MTRRHYNVLQLIFLIIAIVIIFGVVGKDIWPMFSETVTFDEPERESVTTIYGTRYVNDYDDTSIMMYHDEIGDKFGDIVALLPQILLIVDLILVIIAIYKGNEYKNGRAHIVIPALSFACFLITSVLAFMIPHETYNGTATTIPSTGFWLYLLANIAIVAVATLKCTDKFVVAPKKKVVHVENISNVSSADELKKFKDLLDAGVITAEEFEEKKNQLLK